MIDSSIGIDEVGRGCWAGPLLVVAARSASLLPRGLADSKTLSKKRREIFYEDIVLTCQLGEGWVSAREIDELGLTKAMKLGVARSLLALDATASDTIIMDGSINYCDPRFLNVLCVIKADSLHPIVSAASIYAKVVRDRYMASMAAKFPSFGFDKHVGYGTSEHLAALKAHGTNELHRLSFKPVQGFV